MHKIRSNPETGNLFFDFQFMKMRCREYTNLKDTKFNKKQLSKVMQKIESEIEVGIFEYHRYFPNSRLLKKIEDAKKRLSPSYSESPLFKDFANEWFEELEPTWRASTAKGYRQYIDKRLVPYFGDKEVSLITKADILKFRSQTSKNANGKLIAKTINKFVKCLNMILNEAADRFNFTPPSLMIKPLKEHKVHIQPFSFEEVNKILAQIRPDWRDYVLFRFFTGVRSSEVDGLKWKYIDFERKQILIRETFSGGQFDYTKNDSSQREITMSSIVYDMLLERYKLRNTTHALDLVFPLRNGSPIQLQNFLSRVWKPLLAYLKIEYRKPYQTRHTAATLWLAAGENPNWIANQMGHSTTNMLFSVYARYVPNLTHQDGSAMDRLLLNKIEGQQNKPNGLSLVPQANEETVKAEEVAEGEESQFWDNLLDKEATVPITAKKTKVNQQLENQYHNVVSGGRYK